MSHLVLARKYRPHHFTDMVGQNHVVQALCNALSSQRLHHAYMFTGTRGIGKTTVSRILAKSLNCQGPDGQGGITASPCGVCQPCTDIDNGRFVDYTELDAASNRGVDEVQALLEQALYKPVQGRFKVFMIDEVHMLTGHAFNAMLKTLEEPPPYLKFVLATTDPQKIPVTVLSRCLQFNLRPITPKTIEQQLAFVLQAEQISFETAALQLLARAARGSMRDALSLTDQAIAFGGGSLSEAHMRQMLGSVDQSHVLGLIDALATGNGLAVVQACEALRLQGLSSSATLEEMCTVLQRMAVLQTLTAADDPDASDCEQAELQRLAALMPMDETQLLYSICLHGRAELGLAPDEYAGLTMVLLRLLAFKPAALANSPKSPHHAAARAPAAPLTKPVATTTATPAPANPASAAAAASASTAMAATDATAPPAPAQPSSPTTTGPANLPVASAQQQPEAAKTHASAATPQPTAPASSPAPAQQLTDQTGSTTAAVNNSPAPTTPAPLASSQIPNPAQTAAAASQIKHHQGTSVAATSAATLAQPNPQQGTPVVTGQPEAATPAEGHLDRFETSDGSSEDDFWCALVQKLIDDQAITAMARELALQSQLVARQGQQWLLRVERESLAHRGGRERLSAALAAVNYPVQLDIEVGAVSSSPARRLATALAKRQQLSEKIVFDHPLVQSMLHQFDAKIVPGSIEPIDPEVKPSAEQ